jgi:hypothetical protein
MTLEDIESRQFELDTALREGEILANRRKAAVFAGSVAMIPLSVEGHDVLSRVVDASDILMEQSSPIGNALSAALSVVTVAASCIVYFRNQH